MTVDEIRQVLLAGLTDEQQRAVCSEERRVLVVAGAGSGKTEVMARRVAWWIGVDGIDRNHIVAFTFTEKAAEEMKLRVRRWIAQITPEGEDVSLGGMYVGTIHGFCLAKTREYWPDDYHNYDILDESSRFALILRGFNGVLGLSGLRAALGDGTSQTETVRQFTTAYDQLHEHNAFEVALPEGAPPYNLGETEHDWCSQASLITNVGNDAPSEAFAISAARYYAYLRCRRFLDFSTSQTEFLQNLDEDYDVQERLQEEQIHLVVDEVQDINPVQRDLIFLLIGSAGHLTTVGDHRQSIFGFRGAKVEILGNIWNEFQAANDAEVIDLEHNFRSTPRIIGIANQWARTIAPAGGMTTPDMVHGENVRVDTHASHISMVSFADRSDEANWIAEAVRAIVPSDEEGVEHDQRDGTTRGLSLSDVVVLVRSATNVRDYMDAFESAGIPCIVRAGPDLFSQPEVLFFVGILALSANMEEFYGARFNPKSLPSRIESVLGCNPEPEAVVRCSAVRLQNAGLDLPDDTVERVILAARGLHERINGGQSLRPEQVASLCCVQLREFLTTRRQLRRVFPQQIYHWLLQEAGVSNWDATSGRGEVAMYHLGALSKLVTGIETPGWTSASGYRWQIIGLCQYGAENSRTEEQPLIVQPDAVTISTVHSAKGLEFAAVFLADVCASRFPSSRARRAVQVPLSGEILAEIDVEGLSDNANHDGERRLMYVALTRAERFLVVSRSGRKQSKFFRELSTIVTAAGGTVTDNSESLLNELRYAPVESDQEIHLSTSFSDLRYYLGCPHDFYLRKVLGFNPTIDQAFGYGRGVHNLMRAIHTDPARWANLAENRNALEAAVAQLVEQGLFYLRYTTGEPADNMRRKGTQVAADYVEYFADELRELTFEPEKEFETLIEYANAPGGAMVSGAIDIVRRDDPPQVTLIDFKSGDPHSDNHQSLDADEMRLQIAIYAIAARNELQYEPERGLVRYLGGDRDVGDEHELDVPLDQQSVSEARETVVGAVSEIRDRQFNYGPRKPDRNGSHRCSTCDFRGICGMQEGV